MVKTDLTDEEKKLIIEALNNNIEPPVELMAEPGLLHLNMRGKEARPLS